MANAIINVGSTGGQVNISTAAAPATPAVGVVTLYAGTDKALHVKNSDGTDITIAAATAGATGALQVGNGITSTLQVVKDAAGTTGALLLSTVAVTNYGAGNRTTNTAFGRCALISAATNDFNVAIGNEVLQFNDANANVGIGHQALKCNTGYFNVAIGYQAMCPSGGAAANVAIGVLSQGCNTSGNSNVSIGTSAMEKRTSGDENVAVGAQALVNNTNGGYNVALGREAMSCSTTGSCNIGIGYQTGARGSVSNTIGIGLTSQIHPGATGTIVLGSLSNGGTGACNSVVIGNSSRATAATSVVIGQAVCSDKSDSIVIGNNSCVVLSSGCPTGLGSIAIGENVCTTANGYNTDYSSLGVGSNIIIGNSLNPDVAFGSFIRNSNSNKGGNLTLGICSCICDNYNGVIVGNGSKLTGSNFGVIIGFQSCASGGDTDGSQTVIGTYSVATALCSQVFGRCSCSTHVGAVVIGPNINSTRTDTTHVNSLVAFGQAASLTNAVGSTGGSVTLNWNNSNIQTLTLTSNITTLTKSNPIDGAVYTLFLTQGGTGGKTVSWGADVEWPSGTAPTLSTAAGAVDAVSLVYIAGVTGYYGNANLNFS